MLVFLQSKDRAQQLFNELKYDGINCDVVHAGRSQSQRDAAVQRFRVGETWVLITTDLMCRGMDFKGVNLVINYDFPQVGCVEMHPARTKLIRLRLRAVFVIFCFCLRGPLVWWLGGCHSSLALTTSTALGARAEPGALVKP